jgi:ribonuclease HI
VAEIVVYTDGGCSGNPGPGGWAYVMQWDGQESRASGGEPATTNNRMELRAVIEALKTIGAKGLSGPVQVHTDSTYVKNGITTWIQRWERNGWRTSAKAAVKNRELWEQLRDLARKLPVGWHWVTAHSGIILNEECDALVQGEIRKLTGGAGRSADTRDSRR